MSDFNIHSWFKKSYLAESETMDTYKVTGTTSDPDGGGPDYSFEEEVKVDSSLDGKKLKFAIENATRDKLIGSPKLYKFEYIKK
jgi:hypothetical protein